MTRSTYRCFHLSYILVAVTGLVYLWMRYFMQPMDPFAVVNHPWQSHVLHLHIVMAPALTIMIGAFWRAHADMNRRRGIQEGRKSGLTLWTMAIPMIASGYLLQVSVESFWQNVWLVIHLATSLLTVAAYAIHFASHRLERNEAVLAARPDRAGNGA